MQRIYKYKVEFGRPGRGTTLMLPLGARILTVQEQNGEGYMWALVDPEAELAPRKIHIVGTGSDATDVARGAQYLGTFQAVEGGHIFVWHIFEEA